MLSTCLLAVVMCELLPHLQGARTSRSIAHEVQLHGGIGPTRKHARVARTLGRTSEHFDAVDMTSVEGDTILACVAVDYFAKKRRILIQARDLPFWEYFYTKGSYFQTIRIWGYETPRSINCKTYSPPPTLPSFTLRNLTAPALPEDVLGLIASFDSAVRCTKQCGLVRFDMKFLEKCSTPSSVAQFLQVQKEVKREGGDCEVAIRGETYQGSTVTEHTLHSCMGHNSYYDAKKYINGTSTANSNTFSERRRNPSLWVVRKRKFAACEFEPESNTLMSIEKEVERIVGLQTADNSSNQYIAYAKHIFEGL